MSRSNWTNNNGDIDLGPFGDATAHVFFYCKWHFTFKVVYTIQILTQIKKTVPDTQKVCFGKTISNNGAFLIQGLTTRRATFC